MNYLYAVNLSKTYGDQMLFKDVSISINKGQKIALIARNGTGKTTLLKILAGMDVPESGKVELRSDVSIGFLEQQTKLNPESTVKEAIFYTDNPTLQLIQQYEYYTHQLQVKDSPEIRKKQQALMSKIDELGAWDYESKVNEILSKLDLKNLEQKVEHLSGGQKKRIALASILVQEPDFLILDEPTNHLDIEMVEWLEQYLNTKNTTILLVTHDRYFMDKVCDEIIEIDEGVSYKYKGGYSYFLEKKEERMLNKQAQVDNAKRLMRKELDWMRRQPKARGTKAKARIDSFYKIKDTAGQKTNVDEVKLNVRSTYIGSKIAEFNDVSKSYGELKILEHFNYKFQRYDRVGVVGQNGTGKTTFIKMMVGEEKPTTGKIVIGQTVQFGFFRQEDAALNPNKKVIEIVQDVAEYIVLSNGKKMSALQLLLRFLFSKESHYKYVKTLSGGEKRRLQLLTILMKNPNFLILDEPTNDLDLATLNVLEDFLAEFGGCLLVVTHDRYFMDKLVDHLFVFEGNGKVRDFPGNYTQYRLDKAEREKAEQAAKAEAPKVQKKQEHKENKVKKKLSYKEKVEFESLEADIEKLETQKEGLEQKLIQGGNNEDIMNWSKELAEIVGQIESKTDRWLELSEWA